MLVLGERGGGGGSSENIEQVSSNGHKMPIAGKVPWCLMSGWREFGGGGGGGCKVRSNALRVIITWGPLHGQTDWLMDRHVWKHHVPATSFASGNKYLQLFLIICKERYGYPNSRLILQVKKPETRNKVTTPGKEEIVTVTRNVVTRGSQPPK